MQSSISGKVSDSLADKTVVLAVTGSIAAVRTLDLVRDLIRRGAKVHCVMSAAAQQIIHPHALEYASSNPVITEITGMVEHVALLGDDGEADALLIAPATANTIGKVALGIDDTPVTTFATTAIGSGKAVMVVPAMHEAMYRHPAVLRNLESLKAMGAIVVDPRLEEGKAKIAENSRIALEMERMLGPRTLEGKRILITSGATAERIDPIRILTNRASGRTGVELALEAYRRGAMPTVVHRARLGLPFPEIYVECAAEMLEAVLCELDSGYHAMISAAAIGDYTIEESSTKIKSGGDLSLCLVPTVKVVKTARLAHPDLVIAGFKAETNLSEEELLSRARESMIASGLDLMIANDVGAGGMGTEENRVYILGGKGSQIQATGRKSLIARRILDALEEVLR